MMQTEPPRVLSSPSFGSHSSETFAQIAARVIHELRLDPHYSNHLGDENLFDSWPQNDNLDDHPHANDNIVDDKDDDDEDFEFSFVSRDPNSSPVSADDIFHNGQIRPTYPLFGRDILNGVVSASPLPAETATARRSLPLRTLMFEERETTTSCSSSEGGSNELEGVAQGTYCAWTPRTCKKSSSAGSSSSRRWRLRDLLLIRSHSDGKEPLLFAGPAKRTGEGGAAAKGGEQGKRKSFLPYRREWVGLFGNGNVGAGRDSQLP